MARSSEYFAPLREQGEPLAMSRCIKKPRTIPEHVSRWDLARNTAPVMCYFVRNFTLIDCVVLARWREKLQIWPYFRIQNSVLALSRGADTKLSAGVLQALCPIHQKRFWTQTAILASAKILTSEFCSLTPIFSYRAIFQLFEDALLWPPYAIGQAIIFCPVVSSIFFFFFPRVTAWHSSSGRQPNCGVEQSAPPIFGRAAITLGTGPHSSVDFFDRIFPPNFYFWSIWSIDLKRASYVSPHCDKFHTIASLRMTVTTIQSTSNFAHKVVFGDNSKRYVRLTENAALPS